ncbi:MAG: hypothetical protein ACJAZX_001519 [Rickettsiales bacterium]|jgi:hypothetical protein
MTIHLNNNKIMKNSNLFKIFVASQFTLGCFVSFSANAKDLTRPDDHAPIGVMRDHVHKKNEYMLSYRYALMNMKGARSGSDEVSSDQILKKHMMAPEEMDMKMHMVGAMYGITDNLTLAAMGSFVEKDMRMVNRMNKIIDREISGFGDTKIQSMYQFFKNSNNRAQFNLGLSVPTGSIKQEHEGTRLGYPMQFGSGSYEALPGISYSGHQNSYSYGAQANAVFRLNNNNNDYKLGDSYNLTAWTATKLNESFSISSRLNYEISQKIKGSDPALSAMAMMSPVNNTSSSGGKRLDFLVGVNFIVPNGFLEGNRLAIEGGVPIYQNLNGTQLETDYKIVFGWQKAF